MSQAATSQEPHVSQWVVRQGLRLLMALYAGCVTIATFLGRQRRPVGPEGYDILLTGMFHSDNWVMSHIRPLAMSTQCARLRIVSNLPVPAIPKVQVIYPPSWLVRLVGMTMARLATFMWTGLRTRPHIVGGFHLQLNGMVAAVLGKLIGARSIYFCVGGPAEVLDGGVFCENRLFGRLKVPDRKIEQRLLRAIENCDMVITMGHGAVAFFQQRGVQTVFHVASGGIDGSRFFAVDKPPAYDLILVGRLVPIKRVDVFLRTVKLVKAQRPGIKAVVVGDGPLRTTFEEQARALGIEQNITFVGPQRDIENWLRQTKLFVLTSDSEGLSLALMEAMSCSLPVVVSDVGDLGDLVRDGVNGYLVVNRTPEAFAARILELLRDPERLSLFSKNAGQAAKRYELDAASRQWNLIFADVEKTDCGVVENASSTLERL